MAIGVLVLGESGTGKTYSIKNFKPEEVKICSVVKPILPFRGKYDIVKTPTARDVIRELKNTKKKNIVIDDFQYILGIPMMHRIGEKGWEKFNEIEQGYSDVLEALNDLPDDTIVYLNSHIETDDYGKRKIKTVGKALDKYITVEGLFMVVLGTEVIDDKYYFVTQNSGNDTLKTPEGMFPSKFIPNDLKYVEDKIRNYYFMDGAKTDEQIAAEDKENTVNEDEVKPKRGRRGKRSGSDSDSEKKEEKTEQPEEAEKTEQPEEKTEPKERKRKARTVEPTPETLTKDTYFYLADDVNVVLKHAGDPVPEHAVEISKAQFNAGAVAISKHASDDEVRRAIDSVAFMNVPEGTDEEIPFEKVPETLLMPRASRRRRKA